MNSLINLLIGVILGIFLTIIYEIANKHIYKEIKLKLKGFQIHHSTLGLLLIPYAFLLYSTLLFGLSLGIIVRHTYKERFVFIEKIKSKP